MAEEAVPIDPLALPTPDKLAGAYGDVVNNGTKGGEGNFFNLALTIDPDSGDQVAIFTHKTVFVPQGKDVPFSGMWLDESHVFTGTWEATSEEKTADAPTTEEKEKEEGKEEGDAPLVQIALNEIQAAFAEADVDASGALGMEEIQAIEEKFGLPLAISANAADWADGKISLDEFSAMLQTNGNVAPPPLPPNAVFTIQSSTKRMQVIEDGAFTEADQPYTKYSWTFRMAAPDYNMLELLDSNYPVSLSRDRFVKGESIQMKYCALGLKKQE